MKIPTLLKEYIWLVNTIYQAKAITLAEINERWMHTEMSGGIEMTRHTFIRHKRAIEETFGIDIECDRKSNCYYISNPRVLRDNSIQQWMLSTLTVSNIVSESMSLQDSILLENIPVEHNLLETIINAMNLKRCIAFFYQKYNDPHPTQRLAKPCCIKLFHQRWYVIDYNQQSSRILFKPYAFDRISKLRLTDQSFELPLDFCADDIFVDSFGIFIGDVERPQRIVIRAFGNERYYIRDLPLHHSQEVLKEGEEYTDYQYFIRPSTDFIAELLSKGDRIEILSPDSIRKRIYEEHIKAAKRYK